MFSRVTLIYCFLIIGIIYNTFSQEITISIKPEKISVGGILQINVTIKNDQIKNYGPFPEIEGFSKSGVSSSSSTNFINGKMSSSQSIIQNYVATKTGVFEIQNFTLKVNSESINVSGKSIIVDESYQEPKQSPFNNFFDPFDDPFDDFFNRNNDEYYEVEADAFLSLSTDKNSLS